MAQIVKNKLRSFFRYSSQVLHSAERSAVENSYQKIYSYHSF